ncbi:MAG: NUDIX domain-containing protein [Eubacteriales bacterium]|jgi:8-oxo-dGTP pyrophosphatase MutT (NUDIX family)|nr:NUDIX domain-containing protein [Eubacteriales bacterium]MDD4105588.1 NUDIX domain-containing protein [Eubacteriales bacterium]MDD4710836.1 NUDIX domain-containing protein [Eubacteriales bacterium]NLO16151.1 NUDIX domain-containing protein [Clostridiales bacterium]
MRNGDLTIPAGEGFLNIRVGAIIMQNGKFLMVGNERANYYYSVGGRVRFGESTEEAVVREVFEETGVRMTIDRLGFIHENFFIADIYTTGNKPIYEIAFFFYMNVPDDFAPVCASVAEDDSKEKISWITPDCGKRFYPDFFRTELAYPSQAIKHIVSRYSD